MGGRDGVSGAIYRSPRQRGTWAFSRRYLVGSLFVAVVLTSYQESLHLSTGVPGSLNHLALTQIHILEFLSIKFAVSLYYIYFHI